MGSLFVWHRQRLSRVVQLKPPFTFRRTRTAQRHVASHSLQWLDESSLRRMKWSRSKAIIPFLQGTAHESHTIPTNMVSIPQLLSTSIPDNWFQPVKHPGRPEDASH